MTDQQPHRFARGTDGPKVIVAGVDGSGSSMRAAACAAGLARRQNAELALVHVRPVIASGAAPGVPVGDATGEIAQEPADEIRETAERLNDTWNVRWEFCAFRGDPYGLVTAADELTVGAVVVGASESAGHRFIGSVAVRVVKAGRRPVTVVP
ncbi:MULTISPECIES: universal stress protein [unclassified Streptomyces]|uniref:universal stress protein n=1 Tax=unclassified Streptomyces TaxID=2593676 RepID=UPI00344F9A70